MPELPEMEALRRQLDEPVRAFPIVKAGPAHVATLKTFDPPLATLEGRRLAGARRRAKRLLFPTEDGELVVLVHLMTAGRLRYLRAGEKGPKVPAFRLEFEGGSQLVLTEAGSKKRAGVWLLTPEAAEAELAAAALAAPRPARDRRHRPRVGERDPASRKAVSVRPVSGPGPGTGAGTCRRDRRRARARARAARARGEGRAHLPRARQAARAVLRLRHADRARRLRGAHGLLLPRLPDRRPDPEGPADVAAPPLGELDPELLAGELERAAQRANRAHGDRRAEILHLLGEDHRRRPRRHRLERQRCAVDAQVDDVHPAVPPRAQGK